MICFFRRPAGGAGEAEEGHSHGGAKPKKEGAMEGMGMEGMDEMGIFTTNIAINNPAANLIQGPGDKKPNSLPKSLKPPGGSSPPAGGMAGMPGMKMAKDGAIGKDKIRSKRYGVIDLPEAIYPVAVPV